MLTLFYVGNFFHSCLIYQAIRRQVSVADQSFLNEPFAFLHRMVLVAVTQRQFIYVYHHQNPKADICISQPNNTNSPTWVYHKETYGEEFLYDDFIPRK